MLKNQKIKSKITPLICLGTKFHLASALILKFDVEVIKLKGIICMSLFHCIYYSSAGQVRIYMFQQKIKYKLNTINEAGIIKEKVFSHLISK